MSSRFPRRLLVIVAATLALASFAAPFTVHPAAARAGSTFVGEVNRYRVDAGVPTVTLQSKIDGIADERADQLARDRKLGHDMDYVKKRLAEENICWERLGEIVAYNARSESERIEAFVNQWYRSDGHRKIMLGSDHTHAGGSYTTASNGYHYAAMVFVKICGASGPQSYGGFTDISDSKFRYDIVWLAEEDITSGCSTTRFCPDRIVKRDQMATFLTRAIGLGSSSKNWFNDDDSNTHHARINRVAEAGVTQGCATKKYCPGTKVSRAQMATFLARALGLRPTDRDYFTDDNGSIHEDSINRLAAAGITTGCATTRYCPNAKVKRDQMAAFLHRAFD